ncbi:MAG: hypothetical protein AAFY98_05470 [Verrucomicrobiota bacterium]
MKTYSIISLLSLVICITSLIAPHADAAEPKAPHGGKLIPIEGGHIEVVIIKDGKVTIHRYDAKLQAIEAEIDFLQLIAQTSDGAVNLEFAKQEGKGSLYQSAQTLPEGDGYPLVLRVRLTPDSQFQNTRFVYKTYICGGCDLQEYACTCEGH